MFSKSASQWNAVDVMGCDGLLHRGLVVNKSKAGLSIGFGIPKAEPALISYNTVFRDRKQYTKTSSYGYGEATGAPRQRNSRSALSGEGEIRTISVGPPRPLEIDSFYLNGILVERIKKMKKPRLEQGDVELLYQLSSNQPWKWFPAQLLSTSVDSLLLVNMQTENTQVRAVVRPDRVRSRSLSKDSVRRSDFAREDVPVPAGFLATRDFCDRWRERFPNTHPVGIVGDRFLYIQSRYDAEIPLEVSILLVNMTETELALVPRGMKRPLDDYLVEETMENSSLIRTLPLEILAEVLNGMENLEQTSLRRVCVRFASVISSPACNVAIIEPSFARMNDYALASLLFTTLSRRVKYVIFAKSQASVDKEIKMLRKMVGATGIKVPHLILVDAALNAELLVDYSNFSLSRTFTCICTHLILENITVDKALGSHGVPGSFQNVDIRIASCSVETARETNFQHVFEEYCATPTDEDLVLLEKWIETTKTKPRESAQQKIIMASHPVR